MPQPTLLTIDEDTNKLKRLQEETEALRLRLSESVKIENVSDMNPGPAPQHPPIMDDFYIIAQYVCIYTAYTGCLRMKGTTLVRTMC